MGWDRTTGWPEGGHKRRVGPCSQHRAARSHGRYNLGQGREQVGQVSAGVCELPLGHPGWSSVYRGWGGGLCPQSRQDGSGTALLTVRARGVFSRTRGRRGAEGSPFLCAGPGQASSGLVFE